MFINFTLFQLLLYQYDCVDMSYGQLLSETSLSHLRLALSLKICSDFQEKINFSTRDVSTYARTQTRTFCTPA